MTATITAKAAVSLEILYEDEHLLAVNKPAGLLVHRSAIASDETDFLVDRLRAQLGSNPFLIHRLDRATSGVVLLAKNREIAGELGKQFMARTVDKRYLAVVRGWPEESGIIDYPLPDVRDTSPRKPASTSYRRLATVEVALEMGRYPQQRYALIEAMPETGRYRQIRKHCHHISHHIIGDTSHGRGDHNRLFRIHYAMHRMLLHAWRLDFTHPVQMSPLHIEAPVDASWQKILERFEWSGALRHAADAASS